MVDKSVVLPIACLSGICAAMLVFIWWWFPKWYKKGVAQDQRDMDEVILERRALEAARAARAASEEDSSSREGQDQGDVEAQRHDSKTPVVNHHTYRPPPIATF